MVQDKLIRFKDWTGSNFASTSSIHPNDISNACQAVKESVFIRWNDLRHD